MHLDTDCGEQHPLLIGADLEALNASQAKYVEACDFRVAEIGFGQVGAQQFALLQVAIPQIGSAQVGIGQIGLAKSTARQVALRETDSGEIRYIEIASADGGPGLRDFASERMGEVGGGEARAKQIAPIHLDVEQLASIEMAKR